MNKARLPVKSSKEKKPAHSEDKSEVQMKLVRRIITDSKKLQAIHRSLFRNCKDFVKEKLSSFSVTDVDRDFSYDRAKESFQRIMDTERHKPSIQNLPQSIQIPKKPYQKLGKASSQSRNNSDEVDLRAFSPDFREHSSEKLPKLMLVKSVKRPCIINAEDLYGTKSKYPSIITSDKLSHSFVIKSLRKKSRPVKTRERNEEKKELKKNRLQQEVNPWIYSSKASGIFAVRSQSIAF